jgi:hypothetical protein
MKTYGICFSTRGIDWVGNTTWGILAWRIHTHGISQVFAKIRGQILANVQELLRYAYEHFLTYLIGSEHTKSNSMIIFNRK